MKKKSFILFLGIFPLLATAQQKVVELTLSEVIRMAQEQSPDARTARHTFRSEYWNYKYYKANYLPAVTLSSSPSLNRAINRVTLPDGTEKFVEQNIFSTNLGLSVTQNISWTGGRIFIETEAQRVDMRNDDITSWQTSPVTIGYSQSLFGVNYLKWDKKIEPIRYTKAKKNYAETLELVAVRATDKFFSLATAQSNLETAHFNYANADTLHRYAKGRYHIGTITENEMLQHEIKKLSEETNRMNAQMDVENTIQDLRSYLGIQDNVDLKVIIEEGIPQFFVELDKAITMANENSPDIQDLLIRKLESDKSVAQAKANRGLKADLYMRFGLTQTADNWRDAYRDPLEQQYISVGISLPILDWGRGKGQVRLAKSRRDLVYTQIEQDKVDFDQNVRKLVNQFNLQAKRVQIAARTDETARRRHDVAYRLYLLGKSSMLDLNTSISEKDTARKNYVNSLYTFWNLYYMLRSITLYDFQHGETLASHVESLIKQER